MEKLVHLLSTDISTSVKGNVIRALGNLVVAERTKVEAFPNLIAALVESMGSRVSPNVQKEAARVVRLLATDGENRAIIVKFPGVADQLAGLLRRDVIPTVREEAINSMKTLAVAESATGVDGAQEGMTKLLTEVNPALHRMASRVLLSETAVEDNPSTSETFIISCYEKIRQQMYQEALTDIENADRLMMVMMKTTTAKDQQIMLGLRQLRFDEKTLTNLNALTLSQLKVFVKGMLEDYHGALSEVGRALSVMPTRSFYWQERGVLRRMMGDLQGALLDLDTRLARNPLSYESFKHRAYVKFLMQDISGASADAEEALKLSSSCQSRNQAETSTSLHAVVDCLGMLPVQFLDYNLQ